MKFGIKRIVNMKSNICIDIGGSYIKYAVFYGLILKKNNLVSTDRANVLNQLKDIIKSISENENDNVNSVGISIPGAVDIEKGIIIHAIYSIRPFGDKDR